MMARPTSAAVATDHLRKYVAWLRERVGDLEAMRHRLDEDKFTTSDWGVLGGRMTSFGPPGDSAKFHMATSEEAAPELKAFKETLEAAHQAAVQRILQLEMVYDDTASGLWYVARDYDESHQAQKDAIHKVGEDD